MGTSFFERSWAYFSTVYANNLLELGLFLVLASAWFFGRHIALGWFARRVRRSLSLVLGGWGTRGKSGTERLKAGLMNAVGSSLVSKTTGCEAMFLIGTPFGGLTEMFLFRPYDKATIWEQFNLLNITRKLKARVFLWECMGLNPAYVRVLQQDWTQDDIATITNTYPDHEDVQGPAGRNIPEVMCEFIPAGSTVLTTEEEMVPILEEGAAKQGSSLSKVGWKQAGLVHKDLLERFPYEEHPYNIALVTEMGAELGLEADFCVREMSDRVVADLGVLKTYPRSEIRGRTLEFVMGMSANERFGAMGNWNRMGFAEHELGVDPQIFVSTVVNNRADRVPRSKVFARMLVHDVSADRHFLIGSNVEGLVGFIKDEWEAYSAELTLFDDESEPLAMLEKLAKRQRIPVSQAELDGLLAAMLGEGHEGVNSPAKAGNLADALAKEGVDQADAIVEHYEALKAQLAEYEDLRGAVEKGGDQKGLDERMRAMLTSVFEAKLVPVTDVHTKGEAIVNLVADKTPPGLVNRIMGMQNIKGTGLDWVYRWQAWEAAWTAAQKTRSDDIAEAEKGFRALATFAEYGILCEAEVMQAIADMRGRLASLPFASAAQLDDLERRIAEQVHGAGDATKAADEPSEAKSSKVSETWSRALAIIEAFVDPTDAVRRRRKSDRIYKSLIAEQISLQRAATELKAITIRQKGGWLKGTLADWTEKAGQLLPRPLRRAA